MARLRYFTEFRWVDSDTGALKPAVSPTITVYEPGTTTPISQTLYAGNTGGTTKTNPFTGGSDGSVEFFLDTAQRVKVRATGTGLGTIDLDLESPQRDPSEEVTLTGTQTLTNKTLNSPTLNSPVINTPSGDVVSLTGTQTLTNKTLNSSQIEDVVIAGIVKRRETGPMIFDVEGYADTDDLNADGTFKIDVDSAYAWNLAADAIRAATINPGGYGWASGRILRFNSPLYTIEHTLGFYDLSSTTVCSSTPGAIANLYCTDDWAGPPTGSPADGVLTAAQSPMIDAVGMANCTVVGIQLCAQKLLDGDPAPTTQPAVGWLIGASEAWNGSAWGGTRGDSNNNTFQSCSTIGWTKYADWAFVGSVITHMIACGGQSYTNEDQSMSLYAGCVPLNTDGDPASAGTAFDSVWYPNDGSPTTNQRRLLRTELGGSMSELVIIRSEFHDMVPTIAADPDVQTNKKRTMLFHRINGLTLLDVPISNSGVAQIDFWGQCLNVDLGMTQNYNKGTSGARSNYFIRTMGVSDSNPLRGITWHNHMGGTGPQVGWIGCGGDSGNNAPKFDFMTTFGNVLDTSVPFFYTLSSYGGTSTTVNLTNSVLDLAGCGYQFGGSIGPSVVMYNVGASEQVSGSGGFNRAKRYYADGTVRMYGGVTIDQGGLTVTAGGITATASDISAAAGTVKGRKLNGQNTAAIAAADFGTINGNWGTSAAYTSAQGTNVAGRVIITSGSGSISANPLITLTWKDSGFGSANYVPHLQLIKTSDTTISNAPLIKITDQQAGSIQWQVMFTPAASKTYEFAWLVLGG